MVADPVDLPFIMLLVAAVLICLAIFMPFTGGRQARRRKAWARFDAVARVRGLDALDRDALASWARATVPDSPHHVLSRRTVFDRFVKSAVVRAAGTGRARRLADLRRMRERLGFTPRPGQPAESSHDLAPGEVLEVRTDAGVRLLAQVAAVDEEGVRVRTADGGRMVGLGPAWISFSREGDGTYRFRSAPVPGRRHVLAHGDFLLVEDRRTEPRVYLHSQPFWVSVERLPDGDAPDDPEGVQVECVDVSVGGLALLADRSVRRGSELGIDLPLTPRGPLLECLRARVVGTGFREGGGRRPHFLHCQFDAAELGQQDALRAAVRQAILAS